MDTPVKILLDRKREGRELAGSQIRELVAAYAKGDVPDYQMAAFAMAVCCRGMSANETLALTQAMRDSGECLDWSDILRPTADKHSTGGVGDKLSLVIQPLAASCGVAVPSLTGRGLGLTGGTADKLESIPGYNASLSLADFRRVVAECGCSMTVQTAEIAPADKKLYALRDVTGTVASIPLIVSSILSKKLAEGAGTLVFDVKCGRGAFMKTHGDALALASALVDGAKGAGRKASAIVTSMDEPLGHAVGNALEVAEAMDVLRGLGRLPADVVELSVEFAAMMVSLAKGFDIDKSRLRCRENLSNGRAYSVFSEMVRLQGGDLSLFESRFRREGAIPHMDLKVERSGYIADIDAECVARVAFMLGAGRSRTDDAIDPAAGVLLKVTHGDRVSPGQPVARLFAQVRPDSLEGASAALAAAFSFSNEPPPPRKLFLSRI